MGYSPKTKIKNLINEEYFFLLVFFISCVVNSIFHLYNLEKQVINFEIKKNILIYFAIFLLVTYFIYLVILRLKIPLRAKYYTILSAFKVGLFLFLFYWGGYNLMTKINIISNINFFLFYTSLIFILFILFRYIYFPLKFKTIGFNKIFQTKTIDNEKNVMSLDSALFKLLSKKNDNKTFFANNSWIYILASLLGIFIAKNLITRNLLIETSIIWPLIFIFIIFIIFFLIWGIAGYSYDLKLIKMWEKTKRTDLRVK
jgi:hypothetical protein